MFEYYYHEILRKTIIGFGTLFNNIEVRSKDNSGDTFSIVKVPLAYGPSQKFLARLEQQPDLNNPFQITLPRMSFEFVGFDLDFIIRCKFISNICQIIWIGKIISIYYIYSVGCI